MQKPKAGEYYLVFEKDGLDSDNIVKIISVSGNIAKYITLFAIKNNLSYHQWDFSTFPDGVSRKLTPLEVELL